MSVALSLLKKLGTANCAIAVLITTIITPILLTTVLVTVIKGNTFLRPLTKKKIPQTPLFFLCTPFDTERDLNQCTA